MKFTVLYAHDDEVKKYFKEERGKRNIYNATLVGLKTVYIIDKKTKKLYYKAYALLYKGSIIGYIRSKLINHTTHRIGWKYWK